MFFILTLSTGQCTYSNIHSMCKFLQHLVECSSLGEPEGDRRFPHVRCRAFPMKGMAEKVEEEQGDRDRQDKDEEDKE